MDQPSVTRIESTPVPTPGVTPLEHGLSVHYRYYVLALLWLVALFRFVDLQIIAVLLEPIKAEFAFSDTQLALLGGLAFALFYAGLGLPIAWLADRYTRRDIIATAVGLWSLMTALCGLATGFVSLFLARMGVGVGEAGAYPPTTSLLCDYFPEHQRARIFSILASAIPAGVFTGFLIGGIVNEYYGWRLAFQIVGIPGIVLALLLHLTVRELPRGFSEPGSATQQTDSFRSALHALWKIPAYRHVVSGACLFTLGAYGSGIWLPSWFMRQYAFSSAEIGTWMALLYGGGGLAGAMLGGWLAEKRVNDTGQRGWYMQVCAWSLLAIVPFACFVLLWPDPVQALCMHLFVTILMHMNIGPVLAMVQALAGLRRRAMAQAVNVLVSNLIALPLGPLLIGVASDTFTPLYGNQALGLAILALMILAYGWAALHFFQAARTLGADMDAAKRNSG
ncbi:MAG: MFS transporter [Pseudomonadales bacterium]|nr:MFS transporter [Pseudomonadales bacterium]